MKSTASYVTGAVDGIGTYVGGLVGRQRGGSISDSYWNWETTGQITPGRGIVWGVAFLSTAEMLDRANFAAFDFETVWDNAGDQTTPFLRGLAGNQVFNGNDLPEGAINTTNRPALYTVIQDVEQLQAVQKDLAGRYLLGYDIDAGATAHWNCDAMGVCAGFEPIGDDGHRFTGVLDGLGHGIAGLVIERPDEEYVGLFGATQDAALRNVGLAGAAIRGRSYVGGLVGHQNGGVVERSYVSGTVAGEESYVGGLVGYQNGGSIREVYATGSVRGDREVGGLVGRQDLGSIAQSYAAGAVSGNSALGGLVGSQVGGGSNISASFFAITDRDGNVVNDGGDPTGAYTGNSYGTAKTWAELTGLSTFTAAGWDVDDEGGTGKTWRLYEGHATPLLRVFLTPLTVTVKDDKATYDGNHQTGSGEYTVEEAFDPARLLGSAVNTGGGINAGTYALGLTGLYSDQQGYDLVVHEGELTIERRVVHLRGSRVYDGTRDLAAEVFTLDNLVEGETLSLSGTGQMNDKGVGAGKEVTLGSLVLGDGEGGLASNYTLVGGDHRVDIAKATITAVTGIAAVG